MPGSPTLAPLIAIVGSDGSGKSTLVAGLLPELAARRPVAQVYLGLGTGDLGLRIRGLPLVGPAIERRLAKSAGQTRTKGETIPGLVTALVVYGFSLRRARRFKQALALRRRGVAVLTDRYPQVEVPGFYDGPGLSAARAGSAPVAWLAARERRLYEWMASHRPTLVIRLNVSAGTAFARKPDHDLAAIARKVAVTPQLRFGGAPIADLDAEQPYPVVRAAALRLAAGVLDGGAADAV